jgi:hypothetical protein
MSNLSPDEIEQIAAKAVRETLLAMGLNTADPDALIELQKDFAYVRAWRESVDAVKRKGLLVSISNIVTGGVGALWMAIQGRG